MAIKFLELDQEFVDKYGKQLTDEIEEKIDKIKDAADFLQNMYKKYNSGHIIEISIYLDSKSMQEMFCLIMGISDGKVCVWLEWNLENIGKIAFDEFPCYNEQDSRRDAQIRKKSDEERQRCEKPIQRHVNEVISAPSLIPAGP